MKKRMLVISALLMLIVMIFASCATHERCPAYGSSPQKQTTKARV